MNTFRKHFLRLLLIAALFGASFVASVPAKAEYPDKPVNMVVAFPAGGATSALARIFAQVAEKHLGQRIVVQNFPGGGGLPGTIEFMKKPADGYWVIANPEPTYLVQIIQGRTPYKVDDFSTLVTWSIDPAALATPKSSDLDSLKKLLEYAKAHPKALTMGVGGARNHGSFALMQFTKLANINVTQVTFQGGAPATTALLGAQIGSEFGNLSDLYRNQHAIHILAIAAPERSPLLPNVPTFKELGFNVVQELHRFMAVRKDVPKDRQAKLQAAFEATLKDPDFAKKVNAAGGVVPHLTKTKTDQYIAHRVEELKELIK